MASTKEALAIIIDVGSHMDQAPAGEETSLQTSLTAINMILQRKMFAVSKDEISLILCGTPNTANDLAKDGNYENITVARPLGPIDWQLLQYVQDDIEASDTSADFLDAIVVAMNTIMTGIHGKRGFVSRRVILFSNVRGEFGDDQLDDIMASMKEYEIEFNVIGPDLDEDDDDGDSGPSGAANSDGKAKTPQQRAGETLLRNMLEIVNGESYSFSDALPALSYFQSRSVRPTPWKCNLEIGRSLVIPINGFIKVKQATASSFKNAYAKDSDAGIEKARTFHLNDEAETEIDVSETVEGHRYGSTLVPFSEDDKLAMKFLSDKCFKVLGFTKSDNVRRCYLLGDSAMFVTADKGDDSATVALSAFIQALYETNTVAIVRRCYQSNSAPKLGCLAPHIKAKYECLIYNELPFSEDVRQFTFGSFPLKSESTAAAAKNVVPTDEQLSAMDSFIDGMDLTAQADDDEEAEDLLKPRLTFNPYLQRIYQCFQVRAMNPDDPLPELSRVIGETIKPPTEVTTKCQPQLDKVKEKFKFTVVAKVKNEETGDNIFQDNDASGEPAIKKAKADDSLDGGMEDFAKAKVTEVGTVRPVEDFLDIISQKDEDRFTAACKMMHKRIEQIVNDSFGTQFYGKAIDCLRALREQCIKNYDPDSYNEFLRKFKDTLQTKGRKDFWEQAAEEKLSLITKLESEESKVSVEEADNFAKGGAPVKEETPAAAPEDPDDLLDDF